jgi:amino acid adenylation domain-containing protein
MSERAFLELEEFTEARGYWLAQLEGPLEEIRWPLDFQQQPGQEMGCRHYRDTIDPALAEKLVRLSKNQDLLLYAILVAVFKILILKYTGQTDIITVSPLYAASPGEEPHKQTLLLRDLAAGHFTFRQWLGKVKETIFAGYKNQHYPLESILESLGRERNHTDLYRAAAVLETIHREESWHGLLNPPGPGILIAFDKNGAGLTMKIFYPGVLFREDTIRRWGQAFQVILGQVLEDLHIRLSDIEPFSPGEKQRLLFAFNATAVDYPGPHTIPRRFAEQVKKTPHHVALGASDAGDLTYEQLHCQVRHTAADLVEKGLRPQEPVGIMMETSLSLVTGILGILAGGGAYLPLDHSYPGKRLQYLLNDSQTRFLLTQPAYAGDLEFQGEILFLHPYPYHREKANADNKNPVPLPTVSPRDPAYVIYTSGSTGKPKGVLIKQGGLANLIHWRTRAYGLSPADITLQLISVAFDVFGINLYSSLLSGGKLLLLPDSLRGNFAYVRRVIRERGVTCISLVPLLYRAILENAGEADLQGLRLVAMGGEKPTDSLIARSRAVNPKITLANEYGPTEITIMATSSTELAPGHTAVIGKPIANSRVYILTRHLQPAPLGVAGELCIAGRGLALGYLNSPQFTADKFIPYQLQSTNKEVPFGQILNACGENLATENTESTENVHFTTHHSRLYRTGDLGRWLADGTIEFLGRVDDQVKIFGHRIEPGEIEARLSTLEPVKEAAVLALEQEDGGSQLGAFYVSHRELSITELRTYLAETLPDYMIPSYFVRLDQIPQTINRKIHRQALRDLAAGIKTATRYVAPQTDWERTLAEIWQEVLKVDKVGIHDNFFDLGGNSVSALQVENKLGKRFAAANHKITKMFEYPTVASYARYLEQTAAETQRAGEKEKHSDAAGDEGLDRALKTMAIIGERHENG